MRPVQLRCEYMENPLGIDVACPRLSWALAGGGQGARQTAYRILVGSSEERVNRGDGDLWDTGRVVSDETTQIVYAGMPTRSGQRCWWRVVVWDDHGNTSESVDMAWWEAGLLQANEWHAKWIAGSAQTPLFRREFAVTKPVRSARLYICGLGVCEARLNGHEAADQPLAPLLSNYPKHSYYDTYDVTGLLTLGNNALGVWLAPSWFGDDRARHDLGLHYTSPHTLIAQLHVVYQDGTTDIVATDDTWKTAASGLTPVVSHREYCLGFSGETFDGPAHPDGWDRAEFDESKWDAARVVPSPSSELRSRPMQPNHVAEIVEPQSRRTIELPENVPNGLVEIALDAGSRNWGTSATILRHRWPERMIQGFARADMPLQAVGEYDFGRHVSGWVELRVTGKPGDWICLFGLDWHRLRGTPGEIVRMRFAHRAFRYVPVFLYGREMSPRVEAVRAIGIQNAVPDAGQFACSDPELNRIHDAAARTWKFHLLSGMPMEGWQERFGTTFPQNYEAALYWQHLGAFYTKWMIDCVDAQRSDGFIPMSGGPIAMDYWSSPQGQCEPLLVPWLMWHYYGDREIVKKMYPVARAWLKFAEPPANEMDKTWKPPAEHGEAELCIGDHGRFSARWYDPVGGDLIDTMFITHYFQIAEELARVVGERDDAAHYANCVSRLKEKANRPEFFDPARGLYVGGDQGCHAVALWTRIAPEETRSRVEAALFRDILEARGGHMNTGFVGTSYLLRLLDELNRPEVAYQIITAKDAPSWRTVLQHPNSPEPLTILPEFFTGGMIPHSGLCGVGIWFYQSVAGIQPNPEYPGFKRFRIRPRLVPSLSWAEAAYESPRGTIRSRWERESSGRVRFEVTVPPNTTAEVVLPTNSVDAVDEPQIVGWKRLTAGVYEVSGGTYSFRVITDELTAVAGSE